MPVSSTRSSNVPVVTVELLSARKGGELARWEGLASSASFGDAYYFPGYVRAYEPVEQTEAIALHFSGIGAGFLIPLLLRTVKHAASGRAFRDAITPYGYGGVLYLGSQPPSSSEVDDLLSALRNWSAANSVVCCVLRLHPLARQTEWFKTAGRREDIGFVTHSETTAVALAASSQNSSPLPHMARGRHSDLQFAQKKLEVSWPSTSDGSWIAAFQSLYEATLHRLRAREFFFFPREYYVQLAAGLGDNFGVAMASQNSQPVGAAMFLRGRNWAHYHLSATSELGRKLKATTLLVQAGARWAAAAGCRLLHLGGGMSQGDSLMAFKASFGGDRYRYSSLSIITDREAYGQLCRERSVWPYGMVPAQDIGAAFADVCEKS